MELHPEKLAQHGASKIFIFQLHLFVCTDSGELHEDLDANVKR